LPQSARARGPFDSHNSRAVTVADHEPGAGWPRSWNDLSRPSTAIPETNTGRS